MNAVISQALEIIVKNWAVANSNLTVAYENVTSGAYGGQTYITCFHLPNQTESPDLRKAGRTYTGLFQVTITVSSNTGPAVVKALADSLDAVFTTETPISHGGLLIYIISPMSSGPALVEPDRYSIPVTCGYTATDY